VPNTQIILSWTTAAEINNKGFYIERSVSEGPSSQNKYREQIAFIEGNGTTTQQKLYSYTDENLPSGTYTYRLKQVDFDGSVNYPGEIEISVNAPAKFALYQNYPNPFNPSTTFKYSLSKDEFVTLEVYDILGARVARLVNWQQKAGTYEVRFDASNLSSGIYFYKIKAGAFSSVKKMILLK